MGDIVARLYPDLHPELVPGAHRNIYNHLKKLEEDQKICQFLVFLSENTIPEYEISLFQ